MRILSAIVILDGYGCSNETLGNAVKTAKTPVFDALLEENPHSLLDASGLTVGLPEGQMGNSEVGHLNMGAGRVVYQELTRITKSIEDGDFYENPELNEAMESAKVNGTAIHLMGLVSDGGVHSHLDHLIALVNMAKKKGIRDKVYIHCFLDGRDTPPTSGIRYVEELEESLSQIGLGKIAVISGRYYAMDRDNRWERTKLAYDAMVSSKGKKANSALQAIKDSYKEQVNDEFILPTVITNGEEPVGAIGKKDSVIFFNFRPDRARQITRALTEEEFDGFERENGFIPLHFTSMTQYDTTLDNVHVAFKPESIVNTLGETISKNGLKQLRIAETEKYAHVTYFFNGGVEREYEGEERVLIPSPKVATYDLKPEMSAIEVAEKAIEEIEEKDYSLIVLNFANCDMVGHTGVFDAAVKAVETVDECLGKVVKAIKAKGGCALITADHGNAEKMIDPETSEAFTAHTTNPVSCIITGAESVHSIKDGKLADIAPTILELLNIDKPAEMTGESLIV